MKFCPNCGTPAQDQPFCEACGQPYELEAAAPEVETVEPTPPPAEMTDPALADVPVAEPIAVPTAEVY
ncbi:MAG: hypothetical protein LBE83_05450, partial [Propionibacteriaceae bacterium]|nr:hypothetical protein [Propionibacteriaceae bacterium]